jgi:hypothetical protein
MVSVPGKNSRYALASTLMGTSLNATDVAQSADDIVGSLPDPALSTDPQATLVNVLGVDEISTTEDVLASPVIALASSSLTPTAALNSVARLQRDLRARQTISVLAIERYTSLRTGPCGARPAKSITVIPIQTLIDAGR